METFGGNVREGAGDFGFFLFEGNEVFGAAEVDELDVDFVFGGVALFKEDNILQLDIEVNNAVLVQVHQGT